MTLQQAKEQIAKAKLLIAKSRGFNTWDKLISVRPQNIEQFFEQVIDLIMQLKNDEIKGCKQVHEIDLTSDGETLTILNQNNERLQSELSQLKEENERWKKKYEAICKGYNKQIQSLQEELEKEK